MEFEAITSQEEFETRLKERLEQKERSVSKQYEGYTSPDDLKKIKEDYQRQIDDLNGTIKNNETKYSGYDEKIKDYEKKIADYETDSVKTRVAIETGLPLELKDRLRGSSEEEIRKDAETLANFAKGSRSAPLASSDAVLTQGDVAKIRLNEGYKEFLKNL